MSVVSMMSISYLLFACYCYFYLLICAFGYVCTYMQY